MRKRRLYASANPGVRILDPDANTLELHVLGERSYVLDGIHEQGDRLTRPVCGVGLDVAELFGP